MARLGVELTHEGKSLKTLLGDLDFVKDMWYAVGETLDVPEDTLRILQQSPQANDHEKGLEIVVKHWKEENLKRRMWAELIEKLCSNEEIFQRNPDRFRQLITAYQADVDTSNRQGRL